MIVLREVLTQPWKMFFRREVVGGQVFADEVSLQFGLWLWQFLVVC